MSSVYVLLYLLSILIFYVLGKDLGIQELIDLSKFLSFCFISYFLLAFAYHAGKDMLK